MIDKKKDQSNNFIKVPEDYFALIDNKGINYGHVCLLSKIESLSLKDGKCTASNAYFASLLHTTDRNIQLMLKALKDNDIIKQFEEKQGLKTTTRYIYVQQDIIKSIIGHEENDTSPQIPHEENCDSTRRKLSEDTKKDVEGHEENGQTTRRDLHPNKRLEEKKKENKRINRENEADAFNESSLFANANVSKSESKFGEFGFPEVDKADEVIALFEKGYKYKSDNPQIQKATGLNGKQIHRIISDYIKSGSGAGKNKSKDDMSDRIPLANGGFSVFRYSSIDISFKDLNIDNEDDKEACIYVFNLYTDPNGEYKFDYHSLKSYLQEKFKINIIGKFNPLMTQKIDYKGIATYQKAYGLSDTRDEIESIAEEIFEINTKSDDIDLMNKLYANDFENTDVPF